MAAFVFDLDGVIYVDGQGIPGAAQTLEELAKSGHQLIFATNNATRSRDEVATAIAAASGFDPDPGWVVTSSMAAAELLRGEAETAYVLGERGLVSTLAEAGIASVDHTEAQAVVAGLDRDLTYGKLRDATLALRRGARFVATNRDETYPTGDGQWPGGGAIVVALEAASGRPAELAGKPALPMRNLIKDVLRDDEVWVIGDRPDTDLAMGTAEGWKTVLVLSGVTDDAGGVDPAPTAVLDTVAGLPELL